MGTRFVATKEAPVHDNVKQALVKATELDTVLVMRALRNTERVLKNKGVSELLEIEREKGANLKIDDILDQVAGVYPRVMVDGQMDAGAWSCGMEEVGSFSTFQTPWPPLPRLRLITRGPLASRVGNSARIAAAV